MRPKDLLLFTRLVWLFLLIPMFGLEWSASEMYRIHRVAGVVVYGLAFSIALMLVLMLRQFEIRAKHGIQDDLK
jgi:hypothetical protein